MRLFSGYLLAVVVVWKAQSEFTMLPGLHVDKVFLEVGKQLAAAKQSFLVCTRAPIKGLARNRTAIVNAHLVALAGAALNPVIVGTLLAQDFDRLVYFCIVDIDYRSLDFDLRQLAEGNFRIDLERGDIFQRVRRRFTRLEFNARISSDAQVFFLYRFSEAALHGISQHFLPHLSAKLLLHDLHGHFSGPEAMELYGRGQALKPGRDFSVDLVERQCD